MRLDYQILLKSLPLNITGWIRPCLGGPNMTHDQQQSQYPWVHTETGPSKVGNVVRPPGSWTTPGPFSRGFSQ